ncbi:rho GTPase-activating protein 7 isoform X2 [Exaiptasia diaphana]|uniref:Uncharacterized protein n=1 Tax=Exaiptasia diaphana TaxID=2652724 RepID=A0A913XJC6_EXADI|nr:rho GTPase-activating protein 7 isoform X2 [Exaiptasia diaphana]
MRDDKAEQSSGCLPFKAASALFEPPVKRSRRRYLMKQRMKEWEGAKLLTMRMEASTLTESVSSPNIILGRRTSNHDRPPRIAAYTMPSIKTEKDSEKGTSIFRSEGNLKKTSTLDRMQKPFRLAELEALEACYWLKAAGFPQYAQSYEEGRFPIDIATVIKEHDFLDEDSLQSLYRRLQTLNHCSKLNLHIKRIDGYDSDEEDLITLSSRWKLQNKNRNWARRKRSASSQFSGSDSSTIGSNSHSSSSSLRQKTGSTDILNERCINSNVRQLSLQAVDRISSNKLISPYNGSMNEGGIRSSLYDNMPSGISLSTPSISSCSGNNDNGIDSKTSSNNNRTKLTSSDLGLADTLSADELSDLEENDDVPSDLMNIKNTRIYTTPTKNATTEEPSSNRHKACRWHSFERSSKPNVPVRSTKISKLSAGQLAVLRKYSLLKVTALIERYTHSNRGMWNWSFPQFLKKFKTPDYKDKKVFGVPMSVILQRSGQPLPKPILIAMNYLQRTGFSSVGIFRKSGGKSRIHNLKEMLEDNQVTDFEGMSPFDLADMLKEYFRDLPAPILTSKLAETFIAIYSDIPEELRIEALQGAILLMPDENREALQTLLLFLNEVAANSSQNQMNEKNLGVCFAPSLFHLCGTKDDPSAPKRQKRTPINKASKELNDNLAAQECLTQMIQEVDRIFTVPEDTLMKSRFSFIEQGEPVTLDKLGRNKSNPSDDYNTYIESCINGLLKEARDKFKGWVSHPWHESPVEVSYKKLRDGCPLRLWRGVVEIQASPQDILKRITDERHLWDEDLETWDAVEQISNEVDVFHYVTQSMILQPKRSHVVLRARRSNLDHGSCVLVCTSVSHQDAPMSSGVEAIVLAQRYLIEPISPGLSKLTYITRVDQRGRTPDYYKKIGPVCAAAVSKIKDSFIIGSDGPETKV